MTDEQMRLTEAEVIKALECCGNMNECKKECPLDDLGGIDKCVHTLILNALDLIVRKNTELADLNNLLKLSNDIQNEFSEKIDEQKAEIEKLNQNLKEAHIDIKEHMAEIERLIINKNAFGLGMKRLAEDNETIRAETIKEFAERLKKEYADFDKLNEIIQIENLFLCIDDLVKEMTEQKG